MEEFEIRNGHDFLKITLKTVYGFPNVTSHFGGYDTKSILEINANGFNVIADIYISTGEIFEFYKNLSFRNDQLRGSIHFENYETDLEFDLVYDFNGHVNIKGKFTKQNELNNMLRFEIKTDQSFIQSALSQLKAITERYGDMTGVK